MCVMYFLSGSLVTYAALDIVFGTTVAPNVGNSTIDIAGLVATPSLGRTIANRT